MLKTLGLAWNQAMVSEELLESDLRGRVCLVTGATVGGIGYETAKKMAEMGSTVIVVCRSEKNGKEACQLMNSSELKGSVEYMLMDLSDLKSVSQLVKEFKKKFDRLDYLFNNAGVMACPYAVTTQGVEIQFGTNHLGHFLLTVSLMPLIEKVGGRIINVSSVGSKLFVRSKNDIATFCSYSLESVMNDGEKQASFKLYGRSKLANVLFTRKLARTFQSSNSKVTTYSLHPGAVKTNLARYSSLSTTILTGVLRPFFKTPFEGAQSSLHVALSPISQLENGGYFEECKLDEASQFADDIKLQDTLWETSMKLVQDYL